MRERGLAPSLTPPPPAFSGGGCFSLSSLVALFLGTSAHQPLITLFPPLLNLRGGHSFQLLPGSGCQGPLFS